MIGSANLEELPEDTGSPTVKVSGEVDLACVDALKEAVAPFVKKATGRIVFDLSDLQFIDSSGLALFVEIAKSVGTVEFRSPSPAVRRIVELTGLTEVLQITGE